MLYIYIHIHIYVYIHLSLSIYIYIYTHTCIRGHPLVEPHHQAEDRVGHRHLGRDKLVLEK